MPADAPINIWVLRDTDFMKGWQGVGLVTLSIPKLRVYTKCRGDERE